MTAVYDAGDSPSGGGVALVLYLNDTPIVTIQLQPGATGVHRGTSSPMPLRRGTNVLRLVTSVYGPPRPTRAALSMISQDGAILDCRFDTNEAVANIDQTWKLVQA